MRQHEKTPTARCQVGSVTSAPARRSPLKPSVRWSGAWPSSAPMSVRHSCMKIPSSPSLPFASIRCWRVEEDLRQKCWTSVGPGFWKPQLSAVQRGQAFASFNYCRQAGSTRNRPLLDCTKQLRSTDPFKSLDATRLPPHLMTRVTIWWSVGRRPEMWTLCSPSRARPLFSGACHTWMAAIWERDCEKPKRAAVQACSGAEFLDSVYFC